MCLVASPKAIRKYSTRPDTSHSTEFTTIVIVGEYKAAHKYTNAKRPQIGM
jgi:hypothetical protein